MATERPILFYDGGCPLCRREIAHYRRLDRAGQIHWLDIDAQPERLQRQRVEQQNRQLRLHRDLQRRTLPGPMRP